MTVAQWPNPIHDERSNDLLWSRANMAEAIPGVCTTLSWTFWEHGFTAANRDLWSALGVLTADEACRPQGVDPADDFVSIFYGRPVVNVDRVRDLFGRVPGCDPDRFELQMLGSVRTGLRTPRSRRRWPAIAWNAPRRLVRLDRRVARTSRHTHVWWQQATSVRHHGVPGARAALRAAVAEFDRVQLDHGLCLMVGQLAFERIAAICRRVGHDDLLLEIASSGGGTHEASMLDDLWATAHGGHRLEDFVSTHGYHGPDEGALDSRSWREDPTPVVALVERYRTMASRPEHGASSRRSDATARVATSAPGWSRAFVARTLTSSGHAVVRRETTKAAFLQCIDAARYAARSLGVQLHATGAIDDPEDVFHLTLEEAVDDAAILDRAAIARRKQDWLDYHELDVPTSFVGVPQPIHPTARHERPLLTALTGVGASAGRAEGRVRVIHDPADGARLEPGEVLVCRQTDPAWVPLFLVASAVVVEIGGPLSHAAIVAREIGLPCVVAVPDACDHLAGEPTVRVDGTAGTVEVVG